MKVHFGQIYIQPGVTFPFSFKFQHRMSEEITALVKPSQNFTQKYGDDWDLIFRISAKRDIIGNEIRGPSVFRKTKDVEFSIFLPFDIIQRDVSACQSATEFLLQGICSVLETLEIETSVIHGRKSALVESICSDPTMFEPKS
ncbi:MAG: hypothetical protein V4726_15230 [Verrucomicrobiota bacterium]